jgi:hypothetical protein
MRKIACLPALLLIAAAPIPTPADHCPVQTPLPIASHQTPLIHSLADEPGARQEIAVQRTDEHGCVTPIVVRENVGGNSPPLTTNDTAARHTSSVSRP